MNRYLVVSYFINDVVTFIVVTLLHCFDFWTVKNVTGRLLVGLRWWTTVDDEGHETWFFESFDQKVKHNPIDSRIFWWGQIGASVLWIVFLIWRILTILQLGFFWVGSTHPDGFERSRLLLHDFEPLRFPQMQQRYELITRPQEETPGYGVQRVFEDRDIGYHEQLRNEVLQVVDNRLASLQASHPGRPSEIYF